MKKLYLFSRDTLSVKDQNIEFLIRDYTNLVSIQEILDKYKEYIQIYQVLEDERLDTISYKLYGTTDYWDMLVLLNDLKCMTDLPVNYDKVENRAKQKHEDWTKIFGKQKTKEQIASKYEEFLEQEIANNEKYRNFKYIDSSVINRFYLDIQNFKKDLQRKK